MKATGFGFAPGESCIRFKKPDQIPYKLIGELVKKISVKEWIAYRRKI